MDVLKEELAGDLVVENPVREVVFETRKLTVSYGTKPAVRDVDLDIYANEITALIGPSGCGKSTLIRSFNRMNDLIPTARVEGTVRYRGADLYDKKVDAEWFSRSPTRSPSPSRKTLLSV
jgi:ABC-type phosphate transport system ATPase subunit